MNAPDPAQLLRTNAAAARALLEQIDALAAPLSRATALIKDALLGGRKLLCCGNGGSAADAAHFAGEIAGRYQLQRPGFPALDLTAPAALVTALVNDYPPVEVYARQVQALGSKGDVLAAFTTSGNSRNVVLAIEAARARGIAVIAFLGNDGGQCKGLTEVEMIVPSRVTARIQEVHQVLYHTICEALDPILAG